MRGTLIFIALALLTPLAAAQDEPTVNDSDYDTTPPQDDTSYLDEAEMESDTMQDGEFDTNVPEGDTSYLDEAESEISGSDAGEDPGADPGSDTPGVGLGLVLVGVGLLALAWPRR